MSAWPADDLRDMVSWILKFSICPNNIFNESERTFGRVDLLFEVVRRITPNAKKCSVHHPDESKTSWNISIWNTSGSHVEILCIRKFKQKKRSNCSIYENILVFSFYYSLYHRLYRTSWQFMRYPENNSFPSLNLCNYFSTLTLSFLVESIRPTFILLVFVMCNW